MHAWLSCSAHVGLPSPRKHTTGFSKGKAQPIGIAQRPEDQIVHPSTTTLNATNNIKRVHSMLQCASLMCPSHRPSRSSGYASLGAGRGHQDRVCTQSMIRSAICSLPGSLMRTCQCFCTITSSLSVACTAGQKLKIHTVRGESQACILYAEKSEHCRRSADCLTAHL
jgi:hypothetical protein